MNKTIICQICGKEILRTGTMQKYCPECSKILRMQKDRERSVVRSQKRERYTETESERRARLKTRISGLGKINAEARAHGMSYGEYVSKEARG